MSDPIDVGMTNVERYFYLRKREMELRYEVIRTQNPTTEEERVRISLEREHLLFDVMTYEEVQEVSRQNRKRLPPATWYHPS